MTSIKRVGALFVEDNGPHHVILEAELPRALRSSAGSRWCVLASRGVRGWTEAQASCSPNPLEIGVNSGSSACSGLDFKYWEFFSPFFSFILLHQQRFLAVLLNHCDQTMVLESCCWWEVSHGISEYKLDPLLTSTQAEEVKRQFCSPGVQFYTLKCNGLWQIQRPALYS